MEKKNKCEKCGECGHFMRYVRYDVPFFFKQWGAWGADGIKRSKKENGCILDGETFKEYPRKSNEL